MKKLMVAALVLSLSITSSSAVFAAEKTNSNKTVTSVESVQPTNNSNFVDNLVEKKVTNGAITVKGTSAPTKQWTLENGSYTYKISSFDTNIATNYYFITDTGEINVTTNFRPVNSGEHTLQVKVVLYEKGTFYSSQVDSKTVATNGGDSVSFTGLSSSSKYWVSFEKTYDGVDLKGSGTISD